VYRTGCGQSGITVTTRRSIVPSPLSSYSSVSVEVLLPYTVVDVRENSSTPAPSVTVSTTWRIRSLLS
jgi:hypothetical protein